MEERRSQKGGGGFVCPRGGGEVRKRLYEEGLTAGAVTAATVMAMEEEKGNFVGNKGLLQLYYCCFY